MIELKLNPKNPRTISKDKFEKLVNSIREFPKMMDLRPIIYDDDLIILGGNMRYRALQELEKQGFEIKDTWFKKTSDLSEDEKQRFVIEDNVAFGDWDWDILANEWGDLPLMDWGLHTFKLEQDININEMWEGMPEFGTKSGFDAYRSINIHFESQEAVDKFAQLLGQTITEKTKYLWYPRKAKEDIKSVEIKSEE